MATKNKYTELVDLVNSLSEDAAKFYDKGNSAAGTRVRKGIMDIKKLAQNIRLDIQEIKNKNAKKK